MINKVINHLQKQNPTTPRSALELVLFITISEMLCFNRVKINLPDGRIFPNLYGITFMPSGAGKDKSIKDLKKCIPFFENQYALCLKILKKRKERFEEEVLDKIKTNAAKEKKQDEACPRLIQPTGGGGTIEGFIGQREEMEVCSIGHCHFTNAEFGKFLTAHSKESDQILNYLNMVYDGDSEAKIIKGNKHSKPVKGVPQTMFSYSSLLGLTDDAFATQKLMSFITTGLGRRSFLCFPTKGEFMKPVNLAKIYKQFYKEVDEERIELREFFKNVYKNIEIGEEVEAPVKVGDMVYKESQKPKKKFIRLSKVIEITEGAFEDYLEYRYECEIKAEDLKSEALKVERSSRYWKTIKLAGVITMISNPELKITKKIMQEAIAYSNKYGEQTQGFFGTIEKGMPEKIYEFIFNNPNCKKTDIRNANLSGKRRDDTCFLDNMIKEAQVICEEQGMFLNTETTGNSSKYFISKEPQ